PRNNPTAIQPMRVEPSTTGSLSHGRCSPDTWARLRINRPRSFHTLVTLVPAYFGTTVLGSVTCRNPTAPKNVTYGIDKRSTSRPSPLHDSRHGQARWATT